MIIKRFHDLHQVFQYVWQPKAKGGQKIEVGLQLDLYLCNVAKAKYWLSLHILFQGHQKKMLQLSFSLFFNIMTFDL